MQEIINRAAADLAVWREREERFEQLFPGTLQYNIPFLREKLNYLDNIQAKYRRSDNPEEQVTLSILSQERNSLAKVAYPAFLSRLMHKIRLPFRHERNEKATLQEMTANLSCLKETLSKTGFGHMAGQLENQVNQGRQTFSIQASHYCDASNRMDFDLSFRKDQQGQYQFTGYSASINSDQNRGQSKEQFFAIQPDRIIDIKLATNLLMGRSIYMESSGTTAQRPNTWIQLDFNDKDAAGNFRIKEFLHASSFNLKDAVAQLPLSQSISNEQMVKITQALQNGDRQEITLNVGGKEKSYLIEANPQYRSINIYDGDRMVNIATEKDSGSKQKVAVAQKQPTTLRQKQNKRGKGIS